MESLPDDVWRKILQIGIEAKRLDHTDLCSLAIVNNHFDQLTQDPALWDKLISRDFPLSLYRHFQAPSKDLYREVNEGEKERSRYLSFFKFDLFEKPPRTFPARDRSHLVPNIRDDQFSFYQASIRIRRTFDLIKSESFFSRSATQVSSGHQSNIAHVTVGGFGDVSSFFEEGEPPNQPILIQAKKQYYDKKPKRFDKSSRLKVIPNSKSYIPMNRPPHRSMPRKI